MFDPDAMLWAQIQTFTEGENGLHRLEKMPHQVQRTQSLCRESSNYKARNSGLTGSQGCGNIFNADKRHGAQDAQITFENPCRFEQADQGGQVEKAVGGWRGVRAFFSLL